MEEMEEQAEQAEQARRMIDIFKRVARVHTYGDAAELLSTSRSNLSLLMKKGSLKTIQRRIRALDNDISRAWEEEYYGSKLSAASTLFQREEKREKEEREEKKEDQESIDISSALPARLFIKKEEFINFCKNTLFADVQDFSKLIEVEKTAMEIVMNLVRDIDAEVLAREAKKLQ